MTGAAGLSGADRCWIRGNVAAGEDVPLMLAITVALDSLTTRN
jgi:hypothetical protein